MPDLIQPRLYPRGSNQRLPFRLDGGSPTPSRKTSPGPHPGYQLAVVGGLSELGDLHPDSVLAGGQIERADLNRPVCWQKGVLTYELPSHQGVAAGTVIAKVPLWE